ALPLLEQTSERMTSIGYADGLHAALGALGEGYLLAGRLAEARSTARRMLERACAGGRRYSEAEALRILADVHARLNTVEAGQAEELYRTALGIAEQLGTRPLAARCHLGLGKLYRRTGKRDQAHEHLTTATVMYREMGMRFWLEQAGTVLREL